MGEERSPLGRLRGVVRDLRTLARVYRGDLSALGGGGGVPESVVVVLGAQVRAGGKPSRALTARTLHAGDMYLRREAAVIVVSGGVGEHPPSEASIMADILAGAGVPRGKILPEAASLSTRHSAHHVAVLARGSGVRRVALVTDPLHCVRAASALRAEGIEVDAVPATRSPMWTEDRERLGQFLREFGAVIWYGLRRKS